MEAASAVGQMEYRKRDAAFVVVLARNAVVVLDLEMAPPPSWMVMSRALGCVLPQAAAATICCCYYYRLQLLLQLLCCCNSLSPSTLLYEWALNTLFLA